MFALLALLLATAPVQTQEVRDGFEEGRLSAVWTDDRFAPGAVVLQGDVVRSGKGAVRITVQKGEVAETGRSGVDSERAELREAKALYSQEGQAYEQTFSLFLPKDFPLVATRLVLAQWKQKCDGGPCDQDSPVLALRYVDGVLTITQGLAGQKITLAKRKADLRGRWLDFRVRTRFSSKSDGRVAVWLDGQPLADVKGVTANATGGASGYPDPSRFYFKMGLYRDTMAQPMTLYIDDYAKRPLTEPF